MTEFTAIDPAVEAATNAVLRVLPIDHDDHTTVVEILTAKNGAAVIRGRPERIAEPIARAVIDALIDKAGYDPPELRHETRARVANLLAENKRLRDRLAFVEARHVEWDDMLELAWAERAELLALCEDATRTPSKARRYGTLVAMFRGILAPSITPGGIQ